MSLDVIPGLWPAEVDSYDPAERTCRVRIPGVTDGSNVLPEAIIMPPIGDRADAGDSKDHTELRILPGDAVWVMFECGDPRFPIIAGARTKRAGNPTGWRRWRHANIEMTADGELVINAANVTWNITGNETRHIGGDATADIGGNATVEVSGDATTDVGGSMDSTAATSSHQAGTHLLTAAVTIAGSISTGAGPGGSGVSMTGDVEMTGGSLTHNGVNIGATHTHTEQGDGQPTSAPN